MTPLTKPVGPRPLLQSWMTIIGKICVLSHFTCPENFEFILCESVRDLVCRVKPNDTVSFFHSDLPLLLSLLLGRDHLQDRWEQFSVRVLR